MADSDYSGMTKPLERARRDAAREHAAAISAAPQPNRAASESIQNQEGSPMYHGYRVEIPAGWRALQPVFYQAPDGLAEPARPSISAAISEGFLQFRVGVLLCRLGKDEQEALQEFEDGASLEAAFLDQDGQYLQAAPARPAYGVIPLAAPNPKSSDRTRSAECLILLPLFSSYLPGEPESLPPIMMFIDAACVYRSDNVSEAA